MGNNGMEDNTANQENQYTTVEDKEDFDDEFTCNNGIGDGVKNQKNWHVTVKDGKDSHNKVIIVIDLAMVNPIDRILADVLAHLFSSLSPYFNMLPGITIICLG